MSKNGMATVGVSIPPARRKIPLQLIITSATFLAAIVFLYFASPIFFKPNNLLNVLNQSAMLGVLALAMTIVLVGGGIDLSLPANMALSAILGSMAMIATGSVALGCLVMVVAGIAVGVLNGIAVARLGMIPFVVTLAMMTVCGGFSVWITNSVSISSQPEPFFDFFLSRPFGVPLSIYILAAAAIVVHFMMSSTRIGWMVYAVGTNADASRISRVPVSYVLFLTYVMSGALAGLAAILVTARLSSASANVGNDSVVLDIVTACVVGGVSIYGGKGRPLGALVGAVLVIILGNVLNLMGVSFFLGLMAKGALIIGFVALDGLADRS
ncbi:MAG: ABC transporter permease [Hyphomicrobiales bacterium]|nr:ABC transporter permease [Hyphomicrobiales bacterium]